MNRQVMVRAAFGSLLVGIGIAVMLSAARRCDQGEGALEEVVVASAAMVDDAASAAADE